MARLRSRCWAAACTAPFPSLHVPPLSPAGVKLGQLLLARGDVVLIADSDGVRDIYSTDGSTLDATTPLAVLVNKGTASASEVGRDGGDGGDDE